MYSIEKDNFNEIYEEVIKHVLDEGSLITVRGEQTQECVNCHLTLTNIANHKINFAKTQAFNRQEAYDNYCKKELEWYESGSLDSANAPATKWREIADEKGRIQSNYGNIILFDNRPYTSSGTTAYEFALQLLKKDKFSRQVILHYNLPNHYNTSTKDIPCTVSTQILIRNDKISFIVFQRSSDLHWGLIYDLPWHCYLINKFLIDLKNSYPNLTSGYLHMALGSVHIYQKDKQSFEKFLTKRD